MRQATTNRAETASLKSEFTTAYLLTLSQLSEVRARLADARNEQERQNSLIHLQNVRKRCRVLGSLVFLGD